MNRIWNEDDDKIQQHSLSPSEEYTKQQGELNKRTNKQTNGNAIFSKTRR